MEDEKDAFYIVRKGGLIGVYRSLSECQKQAGSSVSHPAISVYKGYGWPKGAEKLVSSFGLKNALFSVNASYVKDDAFGKLIPCPVQQPFDTSQEEDLDEELTDEESRAIWQSLKKESKGIYTSEDEENWSIYKLWKKQMYKGYDEPDLYSSDPPQKDINIETHKGAPCVYVPSSLLTRTPIPKNDSCIIEFDGASKGNPGKAGAGAVLRDLDKTVLFNLREGLGIATNNVAEYRALILGMKFALGQGFRNARVQGDSMLVCMQIQDAWKTKNAKMAELCKEAKELKRKFKSFHIQHIARELNSDADTQANEAIRLEEGKTEMIAYPGGFKQ